MRKRDREKIVKNIELGIESKQGRPISVRPYEEDHKKLEEIARPKPVRISPRLSVE